MAKGTPTAAQATDASTNFGAPAAVKTNPKPTIMAGASMTKAPAGLASGSGYWAPNKNLPAGVTAQWVPPAAAPVTASAAAAPTASPRDQFADLLRGDSWAGGGQRERMDSANYGGRSVGRTGGRGLY
jgi:hypothetical protein